MSRYRKFLIALAGVIVAALVAWLGPDDKWIPIVVAALTALGVYEVPNTPKGKVESE